MYFVNISLRGQKLNYNYKSLCSQNDTFNNNKPMVKPKIGVEVYVSSSTALAIANK